MLIKKIFSVLIILSFVPLSAFAVSHPEITAKSSILINSDTKEVLYEKNAYEFLSMASTTKIMTSILAIESGRLKESVTANRDYNCEGTAISIKKGNTFTLETLVYAMLLESGNDAAELTADFLAGSQDEFSKMMNSKANEIGMEDTCFVTASGLDADGHGTTAYDMALLGSYAINNPVFRNICSTEKATVRYISPDISSTYINHNRLLKEYDGIIGIKTGFTKKSGRCLVTACERNGTTLVAVTLKSPDDWNDHKKLYDYGFSVQKEADFSVDFPERIKVFGSESNSISIKAEEHRFTVAEADGTAIKYKIYISKWLYAPIESGDIVGFAEIYIKDSFIKRINITAAESAQMIKTENTPRFTFKYKVKRFLNL